MVFLISNLYLLVIYWSTPMRSDSFEVYVMWYVVVFCCRFASSGVCDLMCITMKKIEVFNQSFSHIIIPFILISGFIANVKTIAI